MPNTERVTITEADGGPSIRNVAEIVFDNGSVTNQGGGVVRVANGGGGGGAGSVTSVALTAPAIFSVAGSPITSTGTLALTLATQTANRVWAGPTTGSAAAPTFRALVAADLPSIILTSGVTGTLPIANGGTGATTATGAFDALSPMSAVGDMIYGGAAGTRTRLAGNTTATRNFLRQTGNGSVSAAPAWDTILAADIPNAAADGSTKGVATFNADDFTSSGGVIGINYTGGTAASAINKGFLIAADWTTFNAKLSPTMGGLETVKSDHGSMGATETFDLADGNWHTGTLSANCVFTLSNFTNAKGCTMFLGLTQDATGGRTITWPAAVVNPPTISTTANAITWVSLWSIDGGTTIYASTPAALSATATLDTIGSTRGSVLYRGASAWSALTPGTSGFFLKSNGAGADPSYAALTAAGSTGEIQFNTSGAFDGDAELTWDTSTKALTITTTAGAGLRFASAGLAHGLTDWFPTTTAGSFEINSTDEGGLVITGASDTATRQGLEINGIIGVADPSDSVPCIMLRGMRKSGTDTVNLDDAETILGIAKRDETVVWSIKGNGDVAMVGVLNAVSGTATPASGSTTARLLFGTTAGFGIYFGSGAPTVSAAQGSLYLRSNGTTTNDRIYVNNSSGSGTTWTALTSAA